MTTVAHAPPISDALNSTTLTVLPAYLQMMSPSVVCMYLVPEALDRIRPVLEESLQPGARVLTVGYPLIDSSSDSETDHDMHSSSTGGTWQPIGSIQVFDLELYAYHLVA